MIQIDLIIEAGNWPNRSKLQSLTQTALNATVPNLNDVLPSAAEVSLLFTDDRKIQQLNREWRDQDKPTNVLSFAANEGDGPATPLLGDIIFAFETVNNEAKDQGKSFDHHLTHLIVHGFLHLLGYDHAEDNGAEIMEALEINVLRELGIDDPYGT